MRNQDNQIDPSRFPGVFGSFPRGVTIAAVTACFAGCGGGQSFDDGSDELARTEAEPAHDAGAPSLDDFSFRLTVARENWIEPRGIGDDIAPFVPTFGVARVGGRVLVGGLDDTGAPDDCFPGVAISQPDAAGAVGPLDLPVRLRNGDVEVAATLVGFTLSEVFSEEGPTQAGTLSATLDAREVAPLFTLLPQRTGDNLCRAFSTAFGASACEVCESDGQPYCVTVTAASPLLVERTAPPDIGQATPCPPDAGP